jgi:DNA mismatch repair ATPase MutS
MKNLYLLPTEQPSRLGYLTKKGKEVYKDLRLFDISISTILDGENQNIYITSDEDIKGRDWFIYKTKNKTVILKAENINIDTITVDSHIKVGTWVSLKYCQKIILTTDQDLINDGVQAINDEFLEWFVKNPSCEEVEVGYGFIKLTETDNEGYWISIPNEQIEMQQEEVERMYSEAEVIEILTQRSKEFGTKNEKFQELLLKQDLEWFEQFKNKSNEKYTYIRQK